MDEEEINKRFTGYTNGLQSCNLCGKKIPSYIKRISIRYYSGYSGGSHYKRICESCIEDLSKFADKDRINKWKMEQFLKEL